MQTTDDLLGWAYGEDWDLMALDAREALENHLSSRQIDVAGALARFDATVEDPEDEESLRRAAHRLGISDGAPPEGTSWVRWARWYRHRLQEVVDDPSSVVRSGREGPRKGVAAGATTVEGRRAAASTLWGAYASEVAAWLADPAGSQRFYVVGDTGAVTGQVCRVSSHHEGLGLPNTWEVTCAQVSDSWETTWAGLALRRTAPGAVTAEVLDVHPVDPDPDERGASWRSRFPRLRCGFGGYLGEATLGVWPWTDQLSLLGGEPSSWLSRFAADGEELLRLSDPDLGAACQALGHRVAPPDLRLWLTWMFWRAREFDWS